MTTSFQAPPLLRRPQPRRPAVLTPQPQPRPAARPRTPPVTPCRPVAGGTQGCQLQVQKPCDVQKLYVTATVDKAYKLETARRLRGTPVPAGVPLRVRNLLA